MNHNVGSLDRIVRALAGIAMAGSAFVLPLPAALVLGATGGVLVLTALSARCPGYWLLGRSTCAR